MPQTKYLSTGEFAKIMNTTKETLFHYEEMASFILIMSAKTDIAIIRSIRQIHST